MLTPTELSERWKIDARRLARWRYEGRGPAYVKVMGSVRYRVQDIEAFEAAHLVSAGE